MHPLCCRNILCSYTTRFDPFMLEHHVGRTGHFELIPDSDIYSSELSELHRLISVIVELITSVHAYKLTGSAATYSPCGTS